MIAIPIDTTQPDVKSSRLFGNVNYFALYSPDKKSFDFIENKASGDGVKTARLLKEYAVDTVFYSYMGNGPFNTLDSEGIKIFYLGKESLDLDEIVHSYDEGAFIQVTKENAEEYLDPGTHTGECQCGCP